VEFYRDRRGGWRWRVKAANRKVVADGAEGYSARSKARRGLMAAMGVLYAWRSAKMALCVVAMGAGCRCGNPAGAGGGYWQQARMGTVFRVDGTDAHPASVNIAGANITLATPLAPLSSPPAGMVDRLAGTAERLGALGLGAWLVHETAGGGGVTNNYHGEDAGEK